MNMSARKKKGQVVGSDRKARGPVEGAAQKRRQDDDDGVFAVAFELRKVEKQEVQSHGDKGQIYHTKRLLGRGDAYGKSRYYPE
jgi:hypothetical protein